MDETNLKYGNFWSRLYRYVQSSHLECLFEEPRRTMEENEPVYSKLRENLDEDTDDGLVLYVAACEEFCKAYALAAYEMGLEEGIRGSRP